MRRWRRTSGVLRAGAFVALAVVLAVGAEIALHGGGGGGGSVKVGGSRAAAPAPAVVSQPRVHNATAGAQAVADGASGASGSALTPLKVKDFRAPIAAYRRYARGEAAVLAARVAALQGALASGDRARSRAAWATADSAWRRVGAAYGALGPLGDAIGADGLAAIERGLWARGSARPRALAGTARRLRSSVGRLRGVLRSSAITPLDYATRAHEILEDVQRDDFGAAVPSGSAVRATADGVAATRVVLDTLAPVLTGRGDALAQSRFWLRRLGGTVRAIRRAHGDGAAWPTLVSLTRAEREHLQGQLGAALEALGEIPDELETVLPPKVARIPG